MRSAIRWPGAVRSRGDQHGKCRRAVQLAEVDYAPLPAVLEIQEALQAGSLINPAHTQETGDPDALIANAPIGWNRPFCEARNTFILRARLLAAALRRMAE